MTSADAYVGVPADGHGYSAAGGGAASASANAEYSAAPPAGSRLLAYMQAQRQCASASPMTCSATDSASNVFSQMSIESPRRRVPSGGAQAAMSGPLSPPVFQPGRSAHPSVSIASADMAVPPPAMQQQSQQRAQAQQQQHQQQAAMALRDNVANVPVSYQAVCQQPPVADNHMVPMAPVAQQQQHAQQASSVSPVAHDYGAHNGLPPIGRHSPQPPYASVLTESVGGTMYFYAAAGEGDNYASNAPSDMTPAHMGQSQSSTSAVTPNFSVYPGLPAHIARMRQKTNNSGYPSYFSPSEVKVELLTRQLAALSQCDPAAYSEVPQKVESYKVLAQIDVGKGGAGFFSPHQTSCYKAVNTKDSLLYLLRRVHNFRMPSGNALAVLDTWKKMVHSNVVHLRHVFQTAAFNDSSLVFVYDYHATAETVKCRLFESAAKHAAGGDNAARPTISAPRQRNTLTTLHGGASESLVWSYVIQLTSALRAIHANGMAARTLDPTKIVVVGKNKVLINCCGMMDVVGNGAQNGQAGTSAQIGQQEDLFCLGRLVLSVCCNRLDAANAETINGSMQHIAQHYSNDLKNLVTCLLSATPPNRSKSVNDLMPMIGARFYAQLEAQQMRADMLENELCREIENGRLFRIATKLSMICDRPEESGWSDTGDRYLVRLFRDHVFHAVGDDGKPVVNMAHIVQSLNKVDAAVAERVQLVSADGRNVLIVSYSDMRACLDNCWTELMANAGLPPGDAAAHGLTSTEGVSSFAHSRGFI